MKNSSKHVKVKITKIEESSPLLVELAISRDFIEPQPPIPPPRSNQIKIKQTKTNKSLAISDEEILPINPSQD